MIKKINQNIYWLLISFVLSWLLFPQYLIFDWINYPVKYIDSLDPSWALTLNYVSIKNLVWGKDFCFTYGPLSYLITRVGWGVNKIHFIVFDLFIILNIFYLIYKTLADSKNKILSVFCACITVVMMPSNFGGGTALVLFFLLLFWLIQSIKNQKNINFIPQIIIVCLLFYIKFNTGLIALLLYFCGIFCHVIIFKLKKNKGVLLFFSPLVIICFLSLLLNVSLIDYIISGVEIVKGYNEIMYIRSDDYALYHPNTLLFIIVCIVFLLYIVYINKDNLKKNIVAVLLFLIGLFILYKQAFVRADLGHILEFYKYIYFLILCVYLFFDFKTKSYSFALALVVLTTPLYVIVNNNQLSFSINDKVSKTDYFKTYSNYTEISKLHMDSVLDKLPEEVINEVKNNTIDSYPWNINILFQNKLQYSPRPVIQSYTAYTKYLEDLNFKHYNSAKAPQYVLYDYSGIDNRYPLFDESKMNLVLTKNYTVTHKFKVEDREILLLKKNNNFKPLRFIKQKEYAVMLNAPFSVEKDVYYEIEVYHSFLGKIKSISDFSPEILLQIKNSKSEVSSYKTSKTLLETGMFSTFLIKNSAGFASLINKDSTNNDNKIKQYAINVKNLDFFHDKMKVTEYKIIQ